MKGFKEFLMRGNLVELAIAFVIGVAFAAVVEAFTAIVLEGLAKAGGAPNFDQWQPGGWSTVGPFLTALFAFILMAAVVYFFVVKPYEAAKKRFEKEQEEEKEEQIVLLTEIRDALRAR